MGCSKCKYEFCWICMGSYTRYQHIKGQEAICPIILMIKVIMCLIFICIIGLLLLKTFWYVPSLPPFSRGYELFINACYSSSAFIIGVGWAIAIFKQPKIASKR